MKRTDWIVLGAVVLASSIWCLSASTRLGATFDEPPHLAGGLDYWHTGRFTLLLSDGAMPLAQHLQTLPVYLAEQALGRRLTIESDLGEILRLARPVTLVFWVVLLAAVMRLGRLLGGPWAGRLAPAIVAADPNFLAHASLATTDLALAACFTAFAGQLLASRREPFLQRVLMTATLFGLTLTAKVSALALLPFAVALVWLHEPHDRIALRRLLLDAIAIVAIGLLFNILYCGTGGLTWLHGTLSTMPTGDPLRPLVSWLGSLPIFPNAIYAIWFQFAHNVTGQPVFVAGQTRTEALWYYVPLVLTIKLTVPLLAGTVFALSAARHRRVLLGAAGFLVAAMIVFRVQTGIRLLLPLLALVIAWAAARLARATEGTEGPEFKVPLSRRMLALAIPGLMAIESLLAWPDGLRYVNPIWGGSETGYRVVSDSNYDWGQGLPELAAWRRERGVEMAVWYFGTDPRYPELVRYNPRIDLDDGKLKGRLLAVSASLLYGGYLETPDRGRELIEQLRAETPIARTSTFFVFGERP